MLCKYKNIFGKVNTGVHKYRLFNIAIIDVLATLIVAYIITYFSKSWNFRIVLLVLFIAGIILHRIFCVRTTIDKLLFKI